MLVKALLWRWSIWYLRKVVIKAEAKLSRLINEKHKKKIAKLPIETN